MIEESVQEEKPKNKSRVNTKDELINNIKEWIKNDNELTKMKADIKEKTKKQKELTQVLVDVMKTNSIDCFDINGGALVYKQKKTKKQVSGKFLLQQLELLYADDPEKGKAIAKKVLDNREQVIKEEIKRKIDK